MGSDDDIPALRPDSFDEESEAEEAEPRVEKYPQHQPQAPFRTKPANAKHDSDDEIPELLKGDSDGDDDDDEPPPLVGSEDEDTDSEQDAPSNKENSHGPPLPGLKPGFFAKPRGGQRAAPNPKPGTSSNPVPSPKAAPPPAKPAPAGQEKTSQASANAKGAPPPAPKAAQKKGQEEDGSDSEDVPDLLEANEDDEDSGLEDSAEDIEGEQDEPRAYPQGFTGARGRNFYPNFEEEERAAEERRKREAERKRREEERVRERQARKQKELEEKRRRRAEAKARAAQDAVAYENSPEARELAEQARLRAEAEFEKKREQMGLMRERTSNEGEDFIRDAYVCRGTHCPGGQRRLTKTMEYIEYRCTERCLLLYHTGDCHRKDVKLKMEREHGVWKEEEGAPCITPDCPGTLTKGTKWNRFGKVSYQIIDPEKYEKKRREKERQRAEEKAAKLAAKQAARSRKRDKPEEEDQAYGRKARSRTFTTLSFEGFTEHTAPVEPVPEEGAQAEAAKEHKAETEEAPKKKGKRRNAEGPAEAEQGENGVGPSGKQDEASVSGGAKPGIMVLVAAPLRKRTAELLKDEDGLVKEYRKETDKDTVFTLGNKEPAKDMGKRKIDAVPEPTVLQKGKSKTKRVNILEFITSDDPEPALRLQPQWMHANGQQPRGPPPGVQRPVQEEFPELHRTLGAPSAAPSAPLFQGRPKDPFMVALDSLRLHDEEPTPHLVLEDVDGRADDDEVRQLFWEYGIVEQLTRFRAKDVAFVTMSSVQEATNALLLLQNKSLRARKIKPDRITLPPTPAFFASFQPRQWVGVEHPPPAFASPSFPQGSFYDDFGGEEQWEEFEWSAMGGDAFAQNDWGAYPGASSSSVNAKRPMKPDAPEFVPKSVLLAQRVAPQASSTKEGSVSTVGASSAAAPSAADTIIGAETMSQESQGQRESSSASDVSQRPSAANKASESGGDNERPSSAPQLTKGQAGDGAETRPASAPRMAGESGKEEGVLVRPKLASKAASKGERNNSRSTSAPISIKEGEQKRPTSAPSKRSVDTEEARQPDSAMVGEKLSPQERSTMEFTKASRLGAPPTMESVKGSSAGRSASPIPVPASLLAVREGVWPLLPTPPAYAMGLVVATDNATLALYKDSIRLKTVTLSPPGQPAPPIAPYTCALFLLNVDTLELHGYYEAVSAACLPQQDPYTGMMYMLPQPHVAFKRKAACPAPLYRAEVEPIFPRGWWNVPSWQLPLLLPSMQAQMLIQLLADKAEYKKRKGSVMENGQATQRPLLAASSVSIVEEVLASSLSPSLFGEAPAANALRETAAVPATIAAAARASDKLKGKDVEPSSSCVTETPVVPSKERNEASAKGETAKPLFSILAELPGAASTSTGADSGGAIPRLQSPSSPLSPETFPSSPGEETTEPLWNAPVVSNILAEISAAASGGAGDISNLASTAKPESETSNGDLAESSAKEDPVEAEQAPSAVAAEAAPNMQSILDMLLPKAAPMAAPAPPQVPATPPANPAPPLASRPYRPPVKYNPLGSSNGHVSSPPVARESPPLVDKRTACKLCWVRKADFFLKECGHMGPCLLCHEDPRINSSKCPQCSRALATNDPAKFIRMFR